jgi:hypothetical protein
LIVPESQPLLIPAPTTPGASIPAAVPATDLSNAKSVMPAHGGPPPASADGGYPAKKPLEGLLDDIKIPNGAGLSMKILPGTDLLAGSHISFRISSRKPGYLILIDVDTTGKLSQIYPNPMSLMMPGGAAKKSNFLTPSKVLQLPDRDNPYSGFEFVATAPSGTAMVIALLSEHPVQLVDLPDVPSSLVGSGLTVNYLIKLADQLRIPNEAKDGGLQDAHWSFDVAAYNIH